MEAKTQKSLGDEKEEEGGNTLGVKRERKTTKRFKVEEGNERLEAVKLKKRKGKVEVEVEDVGIVGGILVGNTCGEYLWGI